MGLSQEIRQKLINSFKTEQQEHVQKINQGLLALEKNPAGQERQALLNEIFREAHSLKGAARAVGMATIESVGHGLEDVLLSAKEGRLAFSSDLFDLLYQALDAVELLVDRVEAGQSTPPAKVLSLLTQLEEITAKAAETPDSTSAANQAGQELNEDTVSKNQEDAESGQVSIANPESVLNKAHVEPGREAAVSQIQNPTRLFGFRSASWTR
jgi:two-component system chemotaxis sensor kinase CheA